MIAKQSFDVYEKSENDLENIKELWRVYFKKKNWNYLIIIAFTAVDLPFVNFNVMVVGII